jgi:uncharacterized surface protein with fasciclin (FAS1) repeats
MFTFSVIDSIRLLTKKPDNMKMQKVFTVIAIIMMTGASQFTRAQGMSMEKTVMVGGAAMYPSKNIIQNAANSKDHTTLVAAVKAAGLVETLEGAGPFTVFAPTNTAFNKLPKGTVETLLKPENKAMLSGILTCHVVAGKYDSKALAAMIKKGGGKAELTTVNGQKLTVKMEGGKVTVTDAKGGKATVTTADVYQSNGVIHVTDAVSMPG